MKSYAAIDRIIGEYAVCELELVDVQESLNLSFLEKITTTEEILYETICQQIGEVKEGDIIVVEHNKGRILSVCYKDDAEKNRRIERIKAIREKIKKS